MDNMIRSVVREHHWTPDTISRLYLDCRDHDGLVYWYEDIKAVVAEMKKKDASS
jgi:hypothetical protein